MKNKISIIVPMYNCAKTLDRCLGSILNQTYTNFELILINDQSPDNSLDIALKYAKHDERIIVIDNPHGGVSKTRNKGIEIATGDYIQFIDSDDDIAPNMLERMLSTSLEHDADIVACDFSHPCMKNYAGNQVFDFTNQADRIRYYQTTFATVTPWNKLFKREVIKGEFDPNVRFCEDELFNLEQIFNAKKVVTIEDVLYNYYVPPKDNGSSCINNIAKAENFWETKKTFWYMRNALTPKARRIVRENVCDKYVDDFLYARIFDFMIWELIILHSTGVDTEGLVIEMTNIFKEEAFQNSVNYRYKYGICLKDYDELNIDYEVRDFVLKCIDMINIINSRNLDVKPFYACLDLFAYKFIDQLKKKVNTNDIIANAFVEMNKYSTKEAQFVCEYLESRSIVNELGFEDFLLQFVA